MNVIKKIIIMGVVLMCITAAVAGYVWFKIQNITTGDVLNTVTEIRTDTAQDPEFTPTDATPIANTLPADGLKIDSGVISDEQKALAEKVGIDLDTVTITPEMVGCAEIKLGAGRLQEIMDGASPSVLESMSLLGCL